MSNKKNNVMNSAVGRATTDRQQQLERALLSARELLIKIDGNEKAKLAIDQYRRGAIKIAAPAMAQLIEIGCADDSGYLFLTNGTLGSLKDGGIISRWFGESFPVPLSKNHQLKINIKIDRNNSDHYFLISCRYRELNPVKSENLSFNKAIVLQLLSNRRQLIYLTILLIVISLVAAVILIRSGVSFDRPDRATNPEQPQQPLPNATPTVTPAPDRVTKQNPENSPSQPDQKFVINAPTMEIEDGIVKIDKSGNLIINSRVAINRNAIERLIQTARAAKPIPLSNELNVLAESSGVKMGNSNEEKNIVPLSPVTTYTISQLPTFKWQAYQGATYYDISVYHGNQWIAGQRRIFGTIWTIPTELTRGQSYSWQVVPHNGDGNSIIPIEQQLPEPKFVVLDDKAVAEIASKKEQYKNSHLLMGELYLRYHLREDAAREFAILSHQNPHSQTARQLLRSIEKLRGR